MKFEIDDFVKALTPFRSGCSFRAKVYKDGRMTINYGCYCLVNLLTGFERLLSDKIELSEKGEYDITCSKEIDFHPKELQNRLEHLAIENGCPICSGTISIESDDGVMSMIMSEGQAMREAMDEEINKARKTTQCPYCRASGNDLNFFHFRLEIICRCNLCSHTFNASPKIPELVKEP